MKKIKARDIKMAIRALFNNKAYNAKDADKIAAILYRINHSESKLSYDLPCCFYYHLDSKRPTFKKGRKYIFSPVTDEVWTGEYDEDGYAIYQERLTPWYVVNRA